MSHVPIVLIELGKAVKELYDHGRTIAEYSQAVERATSGRDPFPPPERVQQMLRDNERLDQKLKALAQTGVPEPRIAAVGLATVANPAARAFAQQQLRTALQQRKDHSAALDGTIEQISGVQEEAGLKAQAAWELSKFWEKCVTAPLPDIGTVNKTTYFSYSQTFQKLSGSLRTLERSAASARDRLAKDKTSWDRGTSNLEANLRTFGLR